MPTEPLTPCVMQEQQSCRLTNPRRALTKMLLLGVVFLPMQSCFTVHLWGGTLSEEGQDSIYSFEDADITWDDAWLRVLLTPVSLWLDCVTMPVQAILLGDDDDPPPTKFSRRTKTGAIRG